LQVLLDEGALMHNGTMHLTKPLAELKMPSIVQAILASRIDRLPSEEKELFVRVVRDYLELIASAGE
jgi:hypothetical protein